MSRKPLTFTVKENSYIVSRITVGHLMKIEIAKSQISNNQYGSILANRTQWSEYTLDNIDMFAHLMVFFPKLIADMNVETWEDLDPFDLKELATEYKEQFLPWFNDFTEILRKAKEDPTDDSAK